MTYWSIKLIGIVFVLVISALQLRAQVLNVTQAGVVEGGYGATPNLNGASSVFVQGNYAYVVGTGDVLEILDITLPGLPVHKGNIANGVGGANILRPQAVVVSGNYAYITSFGGNAFEIIDVSNPATPIHTASIEDGDGEAPFLNQPWGLAVAGNYAYVVSNISNALEIIDISNPAQPVHKGSLADGGGSAPFLKSPLSIAVAGNYAYIGLGGGGAPGSGGFEIVDITDPASPKHKGFLADGAGSAPYLRGLYSLQVRGSYAYMTSQISAALEIIDITNPALPVHKGSLLGSSTSIPQTIMNPFSVAVAGSYAYVVGQANSGLNIIDISNPAVPSVTYSTFQGSAFSSRSVFLAGNKAYVSSRSNNSLSIVDITDPLGVKLNSTIKSGAGGALLTNPRSIAVSGNYAYVTSQQDRALEILDISNPALPIHKSSISHGSGGALLQDPVSAVVSGNYAYVASNGDGSISIFDVSNPAVPLYKSNLSLLISVSGTSTLHNPTDIFLSGNYLYVVSGDPIGQNLSNGRNNALLIIDVSNPELPVIKGKLYDGSGGAILKRPSSVHVRNNYAYITGFESNSLEIVNVSNPDAPAHVGSITDGTGGALLNKPNAVYISDLGGAANSGAPASASLFALIVSGYSQDGSGSNALEIINVTTPAVPIHVSSLVDGNGSAPYLFSPTAIQVSENYAYVTASNSAALEVINVANPSAPTHAGSLLNGQNGALLNLPIDLIVAGNYVYMTVAGLYNAVNVAYLYGPSITGFTPASGIAGTSVTITGQNFNTFLAASINGTKAPITNVTETTAGITIPVGASIGKVSLSYGGLKVISAANFIVTPTALVASSIEETKFTAVWSDVKARAYIIDVSTDEFQTTLPNYTSINVGSKTTLEVIGLRANTRYQYRVRSSDGVTPSGNSNVITVLSLPERPSSAAAAQVTETSFFASWVPVSGVSGYYLDIVAADDSFTKNFLVGYTNLTIPGAANGSQYVSGLSPFTTYYYRVRAYNNSGTSAYSSTVAVRTIDITPPSIIATSVANATTITAGFSPTFSIGMGDNVSVDTARIYYRGISETVFKSAPLQKPQGVNGSYSVIVQPGWLDKMGMEYYFLATDPAGNRSASPRYYTMLNNPSLVFPTLPFGELITDYRMVSFPYRLTTDNKVTSVYNGVPWNDKTKAALWRWNPSLKNGAGDYVQYTPTSTLQTIDAGNGYWVLLTDPFTPQLANISAPNYNRANLFSMTLKPGWNQIGNPYPVDIDWDEVIKFNAATNASALFSQLYAFDGSGYKPLTGNSVFQAFEGGFVKNLGAGDITIQIPFRSETENGGRLATHNDFDEPGAWDTFLSIQQNGITNQLGGFGMHPMAQAGPDRYDNFNPPAFLDAPEINFSQEEFADLTFSKSVVNVREKYTWQFKPTAKLGEVAQLMWSSGLASSEKNVYLVDQELLRVVDMSTTDSYQFTVTGNSRFQICYGLEKADILFSDKIIIGNIYPNPLLRGGIVNVPILLPDQTNEYVAKLEVYTSVGQLVFSNQAQLSAGLHEASFNFDYDNMPAGILLYKVTVTSQEMMSVYSGKLMK